MDRLTDGYVTDIGYTYGHYPQLNPLHARMAFLFAGVEAPETRTACEPGFGQGLSINLHAAASDVEWWGTDIVPAHVQYAGRLAAASRSAIQVFGQGFDEFCARPDLPTFDFIGLHGVWSWISPRHRAVLLDMVERKLRPGGVLYVSYNTLPGGFPAAALRELLASHPGSSPDTAGRIAEALAFLKAMFAAEPEAGDKPSPLRAEFEYMKDRDAAYLAHEFFNEHRSAMFFREVHELISPLGLEFVSASERFGSETLTMPSKQREVLAGISDPLFAEVVRDQMLNRRFRAEYWVREPRRLDAAGRARALRDARIVLAKPLPSVSKDLRWVLNAAQPPKELYNRLLARIADHAPITVGALELDETIAPFGFERLVTALMFMAEDRVVALAQDDTAIARAAPACDRLNAHILASPEPAPFLASPVTGGGVSITAAQRDLVLRLRAGEAPAEEDAAQARFLQALKIA